MRYLGYKDVDRGIWLTGTVPQGNKVFMQEEEHKDGQGDSRDGDQGLY